MQTDDLSADGVHSAKTYFSDSFVPSELPDFLHLFSEGEMNILAKWGRRAQALNDKSVEPATEREANFVKMCNGDRPPEGAAQHLWWRYISAKRAQERLDNLLKQNKALAQASIRTEEVIDDNRRLKLAHTTVWQQNEQLKKTIDRRATAESKTIFELQRLVGEYEERLGIARSQPVRIPPNEPGDWGNDWREQK